MSDILRMTGMSSGMDTESIISALVSTRKTKVDEAKQAQTKLEWTQTAWKDLNSKIYSLYSGKTFAMRFSSAYNKKSTVTSNSALTVVAGDNSVNGVYTAKISSLAKAGYLTGAKLSQESGNEITNETLVKDLGIEEGTKFSITSGGNTKDIEITAGMTMENLTDQLKSAGVNANFDEGNQRLFISATNTGKANDFSFSAIDTNGNEALKALGLTTESGATMIKGSDAKLTLNDAEFTSSTNSFTINGSTYTVNAMTNEEISITTQNDTSGVYDVIRDFFSEYNDVINSMAKAYNADSAKGYQPLTDEQKDAMTDNQIEEWEKKIKDALLRKDSTLSDVMTAMRSTMSAGIEMDGKMVYLSDFGINTLGYFEADEDERYAYHIDGDSKDSVKSGEKDMLKAAIASDPETVTKFFTQLSDNLYSALTDKMGTTDYSSIYKVYNDKKMQSDYDDYKTKISDLEKKLSEMEDKYYKKFASMETALSKLTSSQNAVSSLFSS